MSTEQTNSEETPKKKRGRGKPEPEVAAAEAANTEPVDVVADLPPLEPVATDAAPDRAQEWRDATAEAEASRVEEEIVHDKIKVKLTDAQRVAIGVAYVKADAELRDLVEEKKAAMADFKERIADIESTKRTTGEEIETGEAFRTNDWIVQRVFSTNTVRYLDPMTRECVREEPMTAADRQVELPLANEDKTPQLSLGDVVSSDPTEATDPEALLLAAQKGDALPEEETLDNEPEDEGDEDSDDEEDGDL